MGRPEQGSKAARHDESLWRDGKGVSGEGGGGAGDIWRIAGCRRKLVKRFRAPPVHVVPLCRHRSVQILHLFEKWAKKTKFHGCQIASHFVNAFKAL